MPCWPSQKRRMDGREPQCRCSRPQQHIDKAAPFHRFCNRRGDGELKVLPSGGVAHVRVTLGLGGRHRGTTWTLSLSAPALEPVERALDEVAVSIARGAERRRPAPALPLAWRARFGRSSPGSHPNLLAALYGSRMRIRLVRDGAVRAVPAAPAASGPTVMMMSSSSGINCGLSPAWPAVNLTDSGRPRASTLTLGLPAQTVHR
jgi:hypothetical protein